MIAPYLSPSQHGFRRYRSCVTQLLQYVHNLATSDAGEQIDNIYLDMEKDFDRVPHEKLLYKLEYLIGFHNPLLHWIGDYLTNKWHRVSIDGISSDWKYVFSGVRQGSIIDPENLKTLLPLYANDAKCSSYTRSTRPRHTAPRRIHLLSME